jgi:hypothetical protein
MSWYSQTFKDSFAAQVGEPDENGCHPWRGPSFSQGYGLCWHGAERYAHRHSFVMHKGSIPPGNLVRHRCDNRGCVNPEHLILGTNRDNMKDALERSTLARGSRRRPDVSEDDVLQARHAFHGKELRLKDVAANLGMSISQASDIMWGRLWRHVPMPDGVRMKPRRRKLKRDKRKEK